ncbi:MAG: DUF503 domain-containing protein [Deltaproteobacteria bacterium]|nr:MAG: DUF503 domain-containing protein [Deltaproteobacteria bacterium]
MVVATLKVELIIHGAASLKEKRSVVKRVISRVRSKFELSVAEVGSLDALQRAEVGCAVVSNDARHANSVADKALDFIESLNLCEIGRADIEIIHI